MKFVDSHCHWTDKRLSIDEQTISEKLQLCFEKHINFFMLGGVDPEEWQRQIELHARHPDNFGICFGLHPYFVSANDFDTCETALDQLAMVLPKAMALGEAGLDFRPHIMKNSQNLQIEMLENQIELAKVFAKPIVFHLVQAHEKALQIFDMWDLPDKLGFVHAFNGSYDTAKKYIDRGLLISVGGAITYEKNKKLQDCIKKIPLEYLLIESDTPDQAPQGWAGPNQSQSIYQVAEAVAVIRNISLFDVLEVNTSNFKRLFSL